MVSRNDSPWYDSVKIYRQEENVAWTDLFKKIKKNLQNLD